MAAKNSYSIDDILSEYSADEKPADVSPEDDESTENKAESKTIAKTAEKKETETADKKNDEVTEPEHIGISESESKASENPPDDTPDNVSRRFSYRSATRIQDKPNKIFKNPENNIRYAHTESLKDSSGNPRMAKKKKNLNSPETKPDISVLDTEKEKSPVLSAAERFIKKIPEIKNDIFGAKSISKKEQGINIKSIPDVDFFSIDIDINEDEDTDEISDKKDGFFKELNKSFANTSENNIDDYNSPGDASLILDDLYNLKSNLTVKLVIQIIAAAISVYFSASPLYNLPLPAALSHSESPHTYSFVLFILAAVVLFSSFPVITSGLKNLIRKKADCDTLAAVSMVFCTVGAAVSTEKSELIRSGNIHIFTAAAIISFLMNTIGKHLIVNRAINNFDMLISSDIDKHSLVYIDNEARAEQLTKGVINDYPILAAVRKTGFAKDFLKYTYSSDMSDKLCRKAVPAILIFSAVMTGVAVLICSKSIDTFNLSFIMSAYSMFLSACSCFGIPIVVNLPLAAAAAEVEENESIILGYQSIDDFYDTNALILDASQLFPEHSIKLCSIKMFSDTKIDDAIIAAASLVRHSESIFSGMFTKIIDNNDSLLEKIENYSYEDSMGLCGWMNNKRVLFGNRQLMVNHNIEGMPPKSKEKDIVGKGKIPLYLSVSGNLAAIFIVKLKADPEISENLAEITDSGVSLIIKSIDSIATVTRISRLFDIPEDMIKIIPSEHHDFCKKVVQPVSEASASVICSNTLSSVSNAVSNIKYIHHCALTGLVMQSTSAIIAVFIVLTFLFLGIMDEITPLMLIFYHMIWLGITMLIIKVKPQ